MRWLESGSPEDLALAVRDAEPSLAGLPVTPRGELGQADPKWWSANAWVGDDVLVKYAWSEQAAGRLAHEIGVLPGRAQPGRPGAAGNHRRTARALRALHPPRAA